MGMVTKRPCPLSIKGLLVGWAKFFHTETKELFPSLVLVNPVILAVYPIMYLCYVNYQQCSIIAQEYMLR